MSRSYLFAGGYGGYPWPGAGNMWGPVPSYKTNVTVKLTVLDPGAVSNNFYLPEISGCWVRALSFLAVVCVLRLSVPSDPKLHDRVYTFAGVLLMCCLLHTLSCSK